MSTQQLTMSDILRYKDIDFRVTLSYTQRLSCFGCHTVGISNICISSSGVDSAAYDKLAKLSFTNKEGHVLDGLYALESLDPEYRAIIKVYAQALGNKLEHSLLHTTMLFCSENATARGQCHNYETGDFVKHLIDKGWYCIATPIMHNRNYQPQFGFVRGYILSPPVGAQSDKGPIEPFMYDTPEVPKEYNWKKEDLRAYSGKPGETLADRLTFGV